MNVDGFELIRIFTSLQLVLVLGFLLSHTRHKVRNRLLSIFLFTEAAYIISGTFYGLHQHLSRDYLYGFYFLYAFTFLLGPAVFLYTQYYVNRSFVLQKRHGIHAWPFLLFLIANLLCLHIPSTDVYLFSTQIHYPGLTAFTLLLLHLQILGYLIASMVLLHRHRKQNPEKEGLSPDTPTSWLYFLLGGFLCVWGVESLIYFSHVSYGVLLCRVKIGLAGLQFLMANIIVFRGLQQPEIFNGAVLKLKYQKNQISDAEKERYLSHLLKFMEKEKPYLTPTLTLQELSELINVAPHHISQILNTVLRKNFYDFVNAYRIEESKKLLGQRGKKTVLEILYEVGFSSKSVFNQAFKKHTGITPTQFRDRVTA